MKKVAKKLLIIAVLFNLLINTLFVNSSFATDSTVDYLTPRKHSGLTEEQRLAILNAANFWQTRNKIDDPNDVNQGDPRFPNLIYCVELHGETGASYEHGGPVTEDKRGARPEICGASLNKLMSLDGNIQLGNVLKTGDSGKKIYGTSCLYYASDTYAMILGKDLNKYLYGNCENWFGALKNWEVLAKSEVPESDTKKKQAVQIAKECPFEYIDIQSQSLANNELLPGDIILNNEHAMLYLGENYVEDYGNGNKYIAHASGHGRNVRIDKCTEGWWNNTIVGKKWCYLVRIKDGFAENYECNPYFEAVKGFTGTNALYADNAYEKFKDKELTEIIYDSNGYTATDVTAASKEVELEDDKDTGFDFSKVIDTILGIMFLIPKVIVVGWTGLMQKLVATDLVNAITGTSLVGNLTVEKIIFNKVPLLDINFFNMTGIMNVTENLAEDYPVVYIIRDNIRNWYNGIRYLGIAGMLITLIYVGIRMAITSVAEEKGKYKKMLKDWAISFIMLFVMHYIMMLIISLNEQILSFFSKGVIDESSLFDQILIRAYDLRLSVGLPATIMYVILVVFTILYLFAYLKRFFTIAILTIFAPIVAISYAIDKVKDGKSQTYGLWLREYVYNVLIQSIHAVIYTIFISTSIEMALSGMATNSNGEVLEVSSVKNALIANMVPAIVFMVVSLRLDKIFRSIFTFSNSKTQEDIPSTFEEIAQTVYVAKDTAKGVLKTGGKILTAPVRIPYKIASKVADKLDKRPSYEKEANPKGFKKFDKKLKTEYKEVSNAAKEVLQGVKQAFPDSLLGWNSALMGYRMGYKPISNFAVAHRSFTINKHNEDFYKKNLGINNVGASKGILKAEGQLKDSFENSFLAMAIAKTLDDGGDLPSGMKAELTSNQTIAIKDYKEATERLQEVKRLEKKLKLCKNEVKKWANEITQNFMENRNNAKKERRELEDFYSEKKWDEMLNDKIREECIKANVNMTILGSTNVWEDWIKEVKHEYIDRNEIKFGKKINKIIIIFIALIIFLLTMPNLAYGANNSYGATDISNALFNGFMGVVLALPKFLMLLIGFLIQGLGSLVLTGIEGAGVWFTPDNMIFNRLNILSINFFDISAETMNTPLGIIKINIRDWYYAIRNLATGALLATLAYIGIRMALSTLSEDKAKYKKLLRYWVESFVILWMLQFIMILIIEVNNQIVALIDTATVKSSFNWQDWGIAALDQSLTGFAWAFCYVAWVGMAAAFFLMYLKRLMVVGFLIVIAPIITITYSIDKVKDGQSQALNNWIRQFMYNVLIQIFHCILYLVFVSSVINLLNSIPWQQKLMTNLAFKTGVLGTSVLGELFNPGSGTQAMVIAVISIPMMLFIWKAEKLLKEIFGFNQADNTLMSGLVAGKMMSQGAKMARNAAGGTVKAVKGIDKATGSHVSKKWNNSKVKNSIPVQALSKTGKVIKDTGLWDFGKAAGRTALISGATGELTPGITYANEMAKYDKEQREARDLKNVVNELKKELQDPKFKQQLDKLATNDDFIDAIQRGNDPNENSSYNEFAFNNKLLQLYDALNNSGETGPKAIDEMWKALKTP